MTHASDNDNVSYVFRYFDVQGYGETTRMLLTFLKLDWSEELPEWPKEKENQPFGHLPVLVEKNSLGETAFVLSESQAIERYLARKYSLMPADLQQAARQEQLRDQLTEVQKYHFEYCKATGTRKEILVDKYREEASKLAEVHARVLRENGNNGHYVGDKTSYIDIAAYAFFKFFRSEGPRALEKQLRLFEPENAPEIAKLNATIEAEEDLAPYFASPANSTRPTTLFK
ncbi:hypothetical protein FBU59_004275 [Linderina macrospora]|uniref:Uncharacterized protein n=1 Tax=Linderina macrospora TaxID=4868 RepID=A0ACC1J652_9FUNG|nr:hypothetical protein FBU59_004275 [Linderina macrospora]